MKQKNKPKRRLSTMQLYYRRQSKIQKAIAWNKTVTLPNSRWHKLTMGEYAGFCIKDLPYSYLRWMSENSDPYWANHAIKELEYRKTHQGEKRSWRN